ncbi:helix-turn-helix domain-containing protein [Modicisalibacter radicis]|uniref:helix-turn-helix domain-containing protein n=1 Tax=Halomonas sp. EAR18 TaxID=2518972 RepID=UPI001444199F|nr:AraC family transcriptional regulator [Halomonas sp. EAR18]
MTGVMTRPAGSESGAPCIDARGLRELSAPLVNRQNLEAATWNRSAPLLEGRMHISEVQPGMWLRLADVRDRYDLVSSAELPAGIKIALVIAGEARVRFGHHAVTLGPQAPAPTPTSGVVVALPRPERFVRQGRAGGHERTLTLSLTPAWLARHGYASDETSPTTAETTLTRWAPSAALLALVMQLFEHPWRERASRADHLRLTGCALTLAGEALAAAGLDGGPASHAAVAGDRRLQHLGALLASGQALSLSQAELAQRLGMSLSSLQRRFRAHHGEALGRYLRRKRLEAARQALLHEGIGVEAAAARAGYTSAANFATAFKREFGLRPSACQARHALARD